ncbi:MAG: type IX secretion system sortase PorU, partial [Prevotella sp.]|nr:type IX secretion system sortase PorU [Prevotella sp.]
MRHTLLYTYRLVLAVLLFVAHPACLSAQRFFNLTAEQVRIDSLLPHFACTIPLADNYADSTYTVSLRYPEFVDMTEAEVKRYLQLSDTQPGEMPEVEQSVVFDRKKPSLMVRFVPVVMRNGRYQQLVSFMVAVQSKAVKRSVRRANARKAEAAASAYADHSVLASGRWVKIRVPQDGVYNITNELISRAGFSNPAKVKLYGYGGHLQNEKLLASELAATDDLQEVPTCEVAGKRLFYGRGPVSWSSNTAAIRTRNPYSDYGCYFLTESDGEPLKVDSTEFKASFYPSAADYHTLHEIDNFSWYHGGRNLFENSPITTGNSKTYTLANTARSATGNITVRITAGARSTANIYINDELAGTQTVVLGDYDKASYSEYTYRNIALTDKSSVRIETTSGGPIRLDLISIAHSTPAPAPSLLTGSFAIPEILHAITNQDHHSDGPADMVIIIPTNQKMLTQAQRLADFHTVFDKMRVRIVPADELYNEFSSGTPDANAYRRYLKMLYDRAASDADRPRFLLLFGDCVWDNRMLTSDCRSLDPDNYLLAFESENSYNKTRCYVDDSFYGLLDEGEGISPTNSDQVDVAVGRFPVVSDAEAKVLVDKTIAYAENRNAGDWQNIIMFMGDDGNNNMHMRDADNAAEEIMQLHPEYLVKKVMWDAYTMVGSSVGNSYPEVTSLLKQQMAQGALIMDYSGHGNETGMSHESVLMRKDFEAFTNTNLPLWVTASCDIMPFDDNIETLGESAVLNKKGGAVAFYGTTRTVFAGYNRLINLAFMKQVLTLDGGRPVPLGEAHRLSRNYLISSGRDLTENKLQYSLLGDPALRLNLPTRKVAVDEINGQPLTDGAPLTLKAGQKVTVKGHVCDSEGNTDTSFNGKLTATVRDTRELVTCKQNPSAEATEKFTFYDRQKNLYNGGDNITEGVFQFSFVVPRDINYADGTGLINLYAVNNEHTIEGHGAEERFCLNGTEDIVNDGIGPSIYCY